jgi:DNA-binding transcriptional regulator GbsR (MarR family)
MGQDPIQVTILSYFIIKRELTQDEIKELTGLSRGTISQEVNELINMKMIKRKRRSNFRKFIYEMNSIEYSFLQTYKVSVQDLIKWDKKLIKMNEKMQLIKNTHFNASKYKSIEKILKLLKNSITFTEEIYKIINKEIESLK